MTVATLITLSQEPSWRRALCGLPHGIAHTWEYWHGIHLTSGQEVFLYDFAEADVRLICPFAERAYRETKDIVSPPGLAGFAGNGYSPQLLARWHAMALGRGYVCGYIGQHPALMEPGWLETYGAHSYSSAYTLDLTIPLDELRGRMSETRKRDLRYAGREGIRLWVNTPAVKRFFVRHFEEAFQRRRARPDHYLSETSRDFFCTLDNFLFLGAGRAEVEAVTVFGFTPYAADGLYNVSFARDTSFSTVLIWAAIQELRARRIPLLNLGGGLRPHDGLARYKQYFGASARPLFCLKQVFDPIRFSELCRSAGVDESCGYFPPYHEAREGDTGCIPVAAATVVADPDRGANGS